MIYACNVADSDLAEGNAMVDGVRKFAEAEGARVVVVSAQVESELVDLDGDDKREFLESLGEREPEAFGGEFETTVLHGGGRKQDGSIQQISDVEAGSFCPYFSVKFFFVVQGAQSEDRFVQQISSRRSKGLLFCLCLSMPSVVFSCLFAPIAWKTLKPVLFVFFVVVVAMGPPRNKAFRRRRVGCEPW